MLQILPEVDAPRRTEPDVTTPDMRTLLRAVRRKLAWIACVTLLCGAGFAALAWLQPPTYTAHTGLMLDARELRVMAGQDPVVGDLAPSRPVIESAMAVLGSHDSMALTADRIGWARLADVFGTSDREEILHRLRSGTDISRVGVSHVIDLRLSTPDPILSRDVAAALAESFVSRQLADRNAAADAATDWLAKQVAQQRLTLDRTEAALAQERRAVREMSGMSGDVLSAQAADLSRTLTQLEADRARLQAQLTALKSTTAEDATSPALDQLRARRSALRDALTEATVTQGPRHPERLALEARLRGVALAMTAEHDLLIRQATAQDQTLAAQHATLQTRFAKVETRALRLADATQRLHQSERDASVARQSYESMLTRLGELRAQATMQRAEARVVSQARVSQTPTAPRPRLMGVMGLMVGLSLGLVAVLTYEWARPGYGSAAAAQAHLGLPVMGVLPDARLARPTGVLGADTGLGLILAERIRQLRTLLTLHAQETPQSIALLSSVPGEGKTTTALALAQACARAGHATIFLDLDLRQSALRAELAEPGGPDLADYLDGVLALHETIVPIPAHGFDMAGTRRHSTALADTVTAERLAQMIELLKTQYDIVIVDAPPVLAVSEGLKIASVTDRLVYLVRWQHTPRKSVQYGLAALAALGVTPDGVVLTRTDLEATPEAYARYDTRPALLTGD